MLIINFGCLVVNGFDTSAAHTAFISSYSEAEHRKEAAQYELGMALKVYTVTCSSIVRSVPLPILFEQNENAGNGNDHWFVMLYDKEGELAACLEFMSHNGSYEVLNHTYDELAFAIQELVLTNPGKEPIIVRCSHRDHFYHLPGNGDPNLTPLSVCSVSGAAHESPTGRESIWMKWLVESGVTQNKESEYDRLRKQYRERYIDTIGNTEALKRLRRESEFRTTEGYRETAKWFKENYMPPF